MKIKKSIFYSILSSLFVLSAAFFAPQVSAQSVNNNPLVKVQNGQLLVLSSDNTSYVPYFIKGVGYEPIPIGRYPSDWGYPQGDPRSTNNNIYDDKDILNRDFSLLQKMNANTIRIWKGNKTTANGRFLSFITNASTTINTDTTQNTLDLAAHYGLKVIAGFWINQLIFDANNNISVRDDSGNLLNKQQIIDSFVNYVNTFKNHRSILFWAIGNETNYQVLNATGPVTAGPFESTFGVSYGDSIFNWLKETGNIINFDGGIIVDINSSFTINTIKAQYPTDYTSILNILKNYSGQPFNPQQLAAWYSLVNQMAYAAHVAEDPSYNSNGTGGKNYHPVAVVNGEIKEVGNLTDGATDAQLPDLDIWGANVYFGKSFGTLFTDYAAKSHKPLWISEFGVDAWSVTNPTGINNWGSTLGADTGGLGTYDQTTQSDWDVALWKEIFNNSSVAIGGTLMEYSDEWWKPYEFYCTDPTQGASYSNTVTAGICNSNLKYYGFPFATSPDGFSNEEWFGVVSIGPNLIVGAPDIVTPRLVYTNLQQQWQTNPWPTLFLNISGSGVGVISSTLALGPNLNCNYSSISSSGVCSSLFNKNQAVTLTFSSSNNSTVTNWGVNGCVSGSNTCNITLDTDLNLNVKIDSSSVSAPTIITQPSSVSVNAPAAASFTVVATGTPAPSYQWMQEASGATVFTAISGATSATYTTLATTSANNGTLYKCVVTNSVGSITTLPATLTVAVPSPVVTITSPISGTRLRAPYDSVTITVNASENGGSVSSVAIYFDYNDGNGKHLITTLTSAPYSYQWARVPRGTLTITAVAVDNVGTSTISSPVMLVVPGLIWNTTFTTNNSVYSAPANVVMTVTASIDNGSTTFLDSVGRVDFYNGSTLVGTATTAPYTFTQTNLPAGTYNVWAYVSDIFGNSSMTSTSTITVNTVNVAPTITTQPANVTLTAPSTATFSVSATGSPSPSYQWMQEAVGATVYTAITGATSASYTTPATTVANNGTKYECVVSNLVGSVTSTAATLTVNPIPIAPVITLQPISKTVTAPATATFTVAATGTPAPSYQWMKEASGSTVYTAISTATAATYTTPATIAANNGTKYECVVTNAAGSVISTAATLTVNAIPVITTQPVNLTVTSPATASFSVVAAGAPAPSYQWMQEASGTTVYTAITGATSASYTTPATTVANNGTKYECVVKNSVGTVTSNPATLTVNVLPVITTQPVNKTVTAPATATFTVAATGTPAPTYQWMQEASGTTVYTAISTATAASYTTPATTAANNGTKYECVVTNAAGSVTSTAATLTVNAIPTITTQPSNIAVSVPSTATFSVLATGAPVPTYQWMKEAPGATVYTAITGATSASYTTPATTAANNGTKYECVVRNSLGTVTSQSATLSIVLNTPPAVSITAPSNNAIYMSPATITISAVASSLNSSIKSLNLYNGTILIGSCLTTSCGATLSNQLPGQYTLNALATDINGLTSTSTVNITVKQPAPTNVSLFINPISTVAPGQFVLAANYNASGTITKIEYYNGTSLIATTAPGTFYTWSNVPAGNYSLTVKVYDNAGNVTTSPAVNQTVSAVVPPVVSITAPGDNAIYMAPANISITATASASAGLKTLNIYNGGVLLNSCSASPCSGTSWYQAAGKYTLTAVATDVNGLSSTAAINVTVNQPAPTNVSLFFNPISTVAPGQFVLAANYNASGTITKIEYYNGTSLIATTAPGTFYTWSNVPAGNYSLTVKVYDDAGNVTASPPVNLTVTSS